MRRAIWIAGLAVAAASGCTEGGGYHDIVSLWPALQIDVTMTRHIRVSAIEVARPRACSYRPFLRTGCGETSDVVQCNGAPPAAWIDEVTLMSGDEVLATARALPYQGFAINPEEYAGRDDLSIVLGASDDQRAVIPIPDTAPPQPAIDELNYDGETLHVGWTATPVAASAFVAVGGAFVGAHCHVPAPRHVDLDWPLGHDGMITVVSFAAPTTTTTAFGEAKVWIGGVLWTPVPDEPSGLVLEGRR